MIDLGFVREEDIISWESTKPDRIVLPYRDESIVCQAKIALVSAEVRASMAGRAEEWQIEDTITDELDKAMVNVCLDLIPSCTNPHVGFILKVRLANGKELQQQEVIGKQSSDAAVYLIDAFIDHGAHGITAETKSAIVYQIECYKKSRLIEQGM